jgi:hypothetical protein
MIVFVAVPPASAGTSSMVEHTSACATGAFYETITGSASQVDIRRAALHRELALGLLRVPATVWADVSRLGSRIIEETSPTPHAMNLTCADDGTALFTLFGRDGREAELWVGEEPSHAVGYVLSEPRTSLREGIMPIAEYKRIARWLSGEVNQV